MKKTLSLILALGMLLSLASAAFAEDAPALDYTNGTPWPNIDLEGVGESEGQFRSRRQ